MALFRIRPTRRADIERAEDRLNNLSRALEESQRDAGAAISSVVRNAERLAEYREQLLEKDS